MTSIMYIVTTMSYVELGRLIKDKRVSLNNAKLLFGFSEELLDDYFSERIGYKGYVVGLRGRLNSVTADVFAKLDTAVKSGERVILEAEIADDMIKYSVDGVRAAAEALAYGLPPEDIIDTLDNALVSDAATEAIEVLCVPYIQNNGHVRITTLNEDNLTFDVEGITIIKVR